MRKADWKCGAAILAVSIAAFGPAGAQELEEILVTAQKREQSLEDVPISLSVLSGDELQGRTINRFDDLQLSVPNFQVTQTGISTQMYIRGIGTGNDPAFEQSVAQFVDGVSYGRGRLTRAPFFDLARVEVLRGPQSVLFGKNTTAGALNLVTATPGEELGGYVNTTFVPEFGQYQIDAALDIPVVESLSVRVAGRFFESDGFVENPFQGRDEPERQERATRITAVFDPVERFQATLKIEHNRFDTAGREIEVVRDDATVALPDGTPLTYQLALAGAGLPGALTNTEFDFIRDANSEEISDNDLLTVNFTTDTRFELGTLTTVTGYLTYERDELADLDFTNVFILTGLIDEEYDQFSQEVRFSSTLDRRVSWTVGAYLQSSELRNGDITGFGPDIANLGFAPLANVGIERQYEQDAFAIAAFGEATWNIIEPLRLVVGLRYTYEEKDATRIITATTDPLRFGASLTADPVAIGIISGPLGVDLNNPGAAGHNLDQTREEDRLTPSVRLEFDVTEDILLFASYSEGFKGGGFDVRGNSSAFFEFEEEIVDSFEGGFRAGFLNGRGQINATGYFAQYQDLQISQFDGTIGFNVGNAGETEVLGVEVDGRFAITENLQMSAAVSFLDFEFTDFTRGNCHFGREPDGDVINGVPLCDYTGQRGRYTPEFTAYASLDYARPLNDWLGLAAGLDLGYTGSHNIHDNLDPLGDVDAYVILDARLALVGDFWEVAFLGRNLLDEEILTFAANVPFASNAGANTQYAVPLPPRTIGGQVSFRF